MISIWAILFRGCALCRTAVAGDLARYGINRQWELVPLVIVVSGLAGAAWGLADAFAVVVKIIKAGDRLGGK